MARNVKKKNEAAEVNPELTSVEIKNAVAQQVPMWTPTPYLRVVNLTCWGYLWPFSMKRTVVSQSHHIEQKWLDGLGNEEWRRLDVIDLQKNV